MTTKCQVRARADHPSTPPAEAESARANAQHLAVKYGIDLQLLDNLKTLSEITGEPSGNYTGSLLTEHPAVKFQAPLPGNYTASFMTGSYAVNCHCAVFSPLDPMPFRSA